MPNHPAIPPQAVAALNAGRVVEAIKIVRETQGLGLKEAKALIDSYLVLHPELQSQIREQRAQGRARFLGWVVLLGLFGWLALRLLG